VDLDFFDCNASFGVSPRPPLRYSADAAGLLEEMDFCRIRRALVWHARMKDGSPVDGNPLLAQSIRDADRLVGAWAVLPHQTGEQPPPREFLAHMTANSIRALWSWHRQHRFLLSRSGMGDLLALLEERRIPLLFAVDAEPDSHNNWSHVEALLRDFPQLTLIAIPASNWGQDRCFRPLIETFERLHIGIESWELAGGVADFVNRYGPDRLIFGSGFPRLAMGGCRSMLQHADISDRDKQAIAAGNLDRLLTEAKL